MFRTMLTLMAPCCSKFNLLLVMKDSAIDIQMNVSWFEPWFTLPKLMALILLKMTHTSCILPHSLHPINSIAEVTLIFLGHAAPSDLEAFSAHSVVSSISNKPNADGWSVSRTPPQSGPRASCCLSHSPSLCQTEFFIFAFLHCFNKL